MTTADLAELLRVPGARPSRGLASAVRRLESAEAHAQGEPSLLGVVIAASDAAKASAQLTAEALRQVSEASPEEKARLEAELRCARIESGVAIEIARALRGATVR